MFKYNQFLNVLNWEKIFGYSSIIIKFNEICLHYLLSSWFHLCNSIENTLITDIYIELWPLNQTQLLSCLVSIAEMLISSHI